MKKDQFSINTSNKKGLSGFIDLFQENTEHFLGGFYIYLQFQSVPLLNLRLPPFFNTKNQNILNILAESDGFFVSRKYIPGIIHAVYIIGKK